MTDRPILMSAPMVLAILAGTKTQTRRVVKPQPEAVHDGEPYWHVGGYRAWRHRDITDVLRMGGNDLICPYGQPGDRLWVRETWMPDAPRNGEWDDVQFFGCGMSPLSLIPECYRKPWHCLHRATYEGCELVGWKPSIHMPRWASRITLEVTGVRVERLQDISRGDAMAEGCPFPNMAQGDDPRKWYADLWNEINGPGSWDANPWVWVVEFRRVPPLAQGPEERKQ